ncbi:MAG: hypothetical protein HXL18_04970 [Peptostreptococcus sp.]|jgi:hypothetical protein|nr:hypothetical protein [uncultured Peptostreptococcus sp.]MBF1064071.1 hypothetical protein [Peptostreptococcus sp.]
MSARQAILGLIALLGLGFLTIIFSMYKFMKNRGIAGKSLMESPVNDQADDSKMGLGELFIYISFIAIPLIYVIQMINEGSAGSPILAKFIILPPVMALFNARKRTGKSIFLCMVAAIFFFYMLMVYAIIGLPVKAPVLTIDKTEIRLAHTSLNDIKDQGFDIYVKQRESTTSDYDQLLTSGDYKKYPLDRSIYVDKGFKNYNDMVYKAPYLLVKDGIVIGNIGFYGDMDKATLLEDSKIVYLRLDDETTYNVRKNSIVYKLEGIDLFEELKLESLEKVFGDKLWLRPPSGTPDASQLHYGIQWITNSDDLFWNQYYSYISFDSTNRMTSFSIYTQIGRDK